MRVRRSLLFVLFVGREERACLLAAIGMVFLFLSPWQYVESGHHQGRKERKKESTSAGCSSCQNMKEGGEREAGNNPPTHPSKVPLPHPLRGGGEGSELSPSSLLSRFARCPHRRGSNGKFLLPKREVSSQELFLSKLN